MTADGSLPEKTPLSVLLFHAAMGRQQSISDFAATLGVGPISLRQFILGKTQRPRQKTLDLISEVLNVSSEEVRRRMNLLPEAAPVFNKWLEAQINGRFSRAKLTRETKISDGALRNYLSGQTLPDADQAQRLAETLQVDALSLASMIVANQVAQSGGETASPEVADAAQDMGADAGLFDDGVRIAPVPAELAAAPIAPAFGHASSSPDEEHVISLYRRLHPQGRRATVQYIATLLAEG
jgi:transcriptional regulator with XRE-family HTH domain